MNHINGFGGGVGETFGKLVPLGLCLFLFFYLFIFLSICHAMSYQIASISKCVCGLDKLVVLA